MTMNQTNQELPLSWDEAKGYLDRLAPDLVETVLSVNYSNPDEFYARLFKVLCEQLARELDKLRACREEYAKERSKWMKIRSKTERKEGEFNIGKDA